VRCRRMGRNQLGKVLGKESPDEDCIGQEDE